MTKTLLTLLATLFPLVAAAFDHDHRAWNELLARHVVVIDGGKASQVAYAGFARDRAALKAYLESLSAVTGQEYSGWSREQKLAFLINAYNAFTVELILTKYPDLKSIKDLGSFVQSPWKKKFFRLLGDARHLDWIEHEQLRPLYNDPRVHAAVNCASIGCPALRNEAFTATRLDTQLDDGMIRFLGDRTRNRVNGGQLEVNAIFKWFKEDFEKGHQGFAKVEDVFAKYAVQLSDKADEQARLRDKALPVTHPDYDWSLNGVGR